MFNTARLQHILVLDTIVYEEITVKGRPDIKTRAWTPRKNEQGLNMTIYDFFFDHVMDFNHPELLELVAKDPSRGSAIRNGLNGSHEFRLRGVRHNLFSFNNGVYN